jgi:histidinol-phosphate aminotransferase
MSRFIQERFRALEPYVPGEQPDDSGYTKLNTNESPYPPAPGVVEALSEGAMKKLNLYPNTDGTALIFILAQYHDIEPDCIMLGNGADELLSFAFHAFCAGGRGAVFADITYGFYQVFADLFGIDAQIIPLEDGFTIDPGDYAGLKKTIVICNPNAPTGIALPVSDIEVIARANPDNVVIVDEAYVDFGAESALPLTRKLDNLLVIHTYSKSRSLAGARLAYAVGHPDLIADMNKMKYSYNPYNVNAMTQLLGEAAIKEDSYYKFMCRSIIKMRGYTEDLLRDIGFEYTQSSANFVFAKHNLIKGGELYRELKERGVLVRHWEKPRIADYIRVTIGTQDQMDEFFTQALNILNDKTRKA